MDFIKGKLGWGSASVPPEDNNQNITARALELDRSLNVDPQECDFTSLSEHPPKGGGVLTRMYQNFVGLFSHAKQEETTDETGSIRSEMFERNDMKEIDSTHSSEAKKPTETKDYTGLWKPLLTARYMLGSLFTALIQGSIQGAGEWYESTKDYGPACLLGAVGGLFYGICKSGVKAYEEHSLWLEEKIKNIKGPEDHPRALYTYGGMILSFLSGQCLSEFLTDRKEKKAQEGLEKATSALEEANELFKKDTEITPEDAQKIAAHIKSVDVHLLTYLSLRDLAKVSRDADPHQKVCTALELFTKKTQQTARTLLDMGLENLEIVANLRDEDKNLLSTRNNHEIKESCIRITDWIAVAATLNPELKAKGDEALQEINALLKDIAGQEAFEAGISSEKVEEEIEVPVGTGARALYDEAKKHETKHRAKVEREKENKSRLHGLKFEATVEATHRSREALASLKKIVQDLVDVKESGSMTQLCDAVDLYLDKADIEDPGFYKTPEGVKALRFLLSEVDRLEPSDKTQRDYNDIKKAITDRLPKESLPKESLPKESLAVKEFLAEKEIWQERVSKLSPLEKPIMEKDISMARGVIEEVKKVIDEQIKAINNYSKDAKTSEEAIHADVTGALETCLSALNQLNKYSGAIQVDENLRKSCYTIIESLLVATKNFEKGVGNNKITNLLGTLKSTAEELNKERENTQLTALIDALTKDDASVIISIYDATTKEGVLPSRGRKAAKKEKVIDIIEDRIEAVESSKGELQSLLEKYSMTDSQRTLELLQMTIEGSVFNGELERLPEKSRVFVSGFANALQAVKEYQNMMNPSPKTLEDAKKAIEQATVYLRKVVQDEKLYGLVQKDEKAQQALRGAVEQVSKAYESYNYFKKDLAKKDRAWVSEDLAEEDLAEEDRAWVSEELDVLNGYFSKASSTPEIKSNLQQELKKASDVEILAKAIQGEHVEGTVEGIDLKDLFRAAFKIRERAKTETGMFVGEPNHEAFLLDIQKAEKALKEVMNKYKDDLGAHAPVFMDMLEDLATCIGKHEKISGTIPSEITTNITEWHDLLGKTAISSKEREIFNLCVKAMKAGAQSKEVRDAGSLYKNLDGLNRVLQSLMTKLKTDKEDQTSYPDLESYVRIIGKGHFLALIEDAQTCSEKIVTYYMANKKPSGMGENLKEINTRLAICHDFIKKMQKESELVALDRSRITLEIPDPEDIPNPEQLLNLPIIQTLISTPQEILRDEFSNLDLEELGKLKRFVVGVLNRNDVTWKPELLEARKTLSSVFCSALNNRYAQELTSFLRKGDCSVEKFFELDSVKDLLKLPDANGFYSSDIQGVLQMVSQIQTAFNQLPKAERKSELGKFLQDILLGGVQTEFALERVNRREEEPLSKEEVQTCFKALWNHINPMSVMSVLPTEKLTAWNNVTRTLKQALEELPETEQPQDIKEKLNAIQGAIALRVTSEWARGEKYPTFGANLSNYSICISDLRALAKNPVKEASLDSRMDFLREVKTVLQDLLNKSNQSSLPLTEEERKSSLPLTEEERKSSLPLTEEERIGFVHEIRQTSALVDRAIDREEALGVFQEGVDALLKSYTTGTDGLAKQIEKLIDNIHTELTALGGKSTSETDNRTEKEKELAQAALKVGSKKTLEIIGKLLNKEKSTISQDIQMKFVKLCKDWIQSSKTIQEKEQIIDATSGMTTSNKEILDLQKKLVEGFLFGSKEEEILSANDRRLVLEKAMKELAGSKEKCTLTKVKEQIDNLGVLIGDLNLYSERRFVSSAETQLRSIWTQIEGIQEQFPQLLFQISKHIESLDGHEELSERISTLLTDIKGLSGRVFVQKKEKDFIKLLEGDGGTTISPSKNLSEIEKEVNLLVELASQDTEEVFNILLERDMSLRDYIQNLKDQLIEAFPNEMSQENIKSSKAVDLYAKLELITIPEGDHRRFIEDPNRKNSIINQNQLRTSSITDPSHMSVDSLEFSEDSLNNADRFEAKALDLMPQHHEFIQVQNPMQVQNLMQAKNVMSCLSSLLSKKSLDATDRFKAALYMDVMHNSLIDMCGSLEQCEGVKELIFQLEENVEKFSKLPDLTGPQENRLGLLKNNILLRLAREVGHKKIEFQPSQDQVFVNGLLKQINEKISAKSNMISSVMGTSQKTISQAQKAYWLGQLESLESSSEEVTQMIGKLKNELDLHDWSYSNIFSTSGDQSFSHSNLTSVLNQGYKLLGKINSEDEEGEE